MIKKTLCASLLLMLGAGVVYASPVLAEDTDAGIAMYRLYNPNAVTGTHHYTTSKVESDNLSKAGWNYENIAWYGLAPGGSNTPDMGKGGTVVNSGTLELYKNTPVYKTPDKSSDIAYLYPAGSVYFDKYLQANGEWWYSYLSYKGERLYIAYSDVKH